MFSECRSRKELLRDKLHLRRPSLGLTAALQLLFAPAPNLNPAALLQPLGRNLVLANLGAVRRMSRTRTALNADNPLPWNQSDGVDEAEQILPDTVRPNVLVEPLHDPADSAFIP